MKLIALRYGWPVAAIVKPLFRPRVVAGEHSQLSAGNLPSPEREFARFGQERRFFIKGIGPYTRVIS